MWRRCLYGWAPCMPRPADALFQVLKPLVHVQEAFWQQLFNTPSGELSWQPATSGSKGAPAASHPPPTNSALSSQN